jgi:hypothetical protein
MNCRVVVQARQDTWAGGIDSLESFLGPLKSLKNSVSVVHILVLWLMPFESISTRGPREFIRGINGKRILATEVSRIPGSGAHYPPIFRPLFSMLILC